MKCSCDTEVLSGWPPSQSTSRPVHVSVNQSSCSCQSQQVILFMSVSTSHPVRVSLNKSSCSCQSTSHLVHSPSQSQQVVLFMSVSTSRPVHVGLNKSSCSFSQSNKSSCSFSQSQQVHLFIPSVSPRFGSRSGVLRMQKLPPWWGAQGYQRFPYSPV